MNRVMVRSGIIALYLSVTGAVQGQRIGGELTNGPSDSHKGSVLIYPTVEIKWSGLTRVKQDTFITLTNDTADPVKVRLFYVNGDPPQRSGERRTLNGWNSLSTTLTLTVDQPVYFSAESGDPIGILPFKNLARLGRADPEGEANTRVVRGFIVAVAVNDEGEEIHWNHLSGGATTIHYDEGSSWEYNAVAFRALKGEPGGGPDDHPGRVLLDGVEYQAPYERLCLNFFTWGACIPSKNNLVLHHDTDVTLLPLDADFRRPGFDPVTTYASYDVWNQNEIRFKGTKYKFTCWDQRLLSRADEIHHHFSREVLQTDFAKAAIDALPDLENCEEELVIPSAMVGVARRATTFSDSRETDSSGRALAGEGCEEAGILFKPVPPGEEDNEEDTSLGDGSEIDTGKDPDAGDSPEDTSSGRTRSAERRDRGADESEEGDTGLDDGSELSTDK